ncbi:hypothetical protein E2C01_013106 [Portunus trituberculatus]|uniref:Uncharacterized protein n=1 Tax=Portunus trituberculatus TaxID=210409 RepID=A0A5B7DG46_PORTR|nr:hypothetical protein [Portunus trituberculatus]
MIEYVMSESWWCKAYHIENWSLQLAQVHYVLVLRLEKLTNGCAFGIAAVLSTYIPVQLSSKSGKGQKVQSDSSQHDHPLGLVLILEEILLPLIAFWLLDVIFITNVSREFSICINQNILNGLFFTALLQLQQGCASWDLPKHTKMHEGQQAMLKHSFGYMAA